MGFGGLAECDGGGLAAGDDLGDLVEVAGADLALVLGGAVAVRLARELGSLELAVGGHPAATVVASELEHAVSTAMLGPRRSNAYETRLASIVIIIPVAECVLNLKRLVLP